MIVPPTSFQGNCHAPFLVISQLDCLRYVTASSELRVWVGKVSDVDDARACTFAICVGEKKFCAIAGSAVNVAHKKTSDSDMVKLAAGAI